MDRKYNLKLDLQFRCNNQKMRFDIHDNLTSDFFIRVTSGGRLVDLEKAIVILAVIKPNQTAQSQFLEVTEGKVYADLNPNMKDQVGIYKAKALLIYEDERVTTDIFQYEVTEDNILNQLENDMQPTAEFAMLQQMLSRLSTIEITEEDRVINEANRILAEEERKKTESNRVEAENIRSHEEADRAKYEATRQSNETSRIKKEDVRVQSENARINNENARINNEITRVQAEQERSNNYKFMTEDEQRRKEEANSHKTAELARVQAEKDRVSEEAKRRTVEEVRVLAENARNSKENERTASEISRVQAENQRVLNENGRKENEINRTTSENARLLAEQQRVAEHKDREKFMESFESKLQQMEADYNEAVANMTNGNESATNSEIVLARKGKTSLREKIDEVDSQIKEKANKNEVRLKNTNITLDDCDSNMLSAIQGGQGTSFELLSIPRDGSVTPLKTTFLEPTTQLDILYEKTPYKQNNNFSKDGFWEDPAYSVFKCEVKENTEYIISRTNDNQHAVPLTVQKLMYSTVDNFGSSMQSSVIGSVVTGVSSSFTTPAGCKYIYFMLKNTNIENYTITVQQGSVATYPVNIFKTSANIIIEDLEDIKNNGSFPKNNSVTLEKLEPALSANFTENFAEITPSYTEGSYIFKDGTIHTNEGSSYSKITVSAGDKYKITSPTWLSVPSLILFGTDDSVVKYYPQDKEYSTKTLITTELIIPNNVEKIGICKVNTEDNPEVLKRSAYSVVTKPYVNINWCALGDSLTDRTTLQGGKNYVDFISENLGFNATNLGIGGTGWQKTYGRNTAFYQRVKDIPLNTDVITIFGSGNDCSFAQTLQATNGNIGKWNDYWDPSWLDDDTTLFENNTNISLAAIINHTIDNIYARLPYVKLGIVTPTPWKDQQNNEAYTPIMRRMADLIKDICEHRSIPCLDLYRLSQLRPDEDQFRTDMFYNGDGVHPAENAHKKYIYPEFREFIKRLV